MFGRKYQRQKPGKPIQARTLNRPIDGLERMDKISAAAPLNISRPMGLVLLRDTSPRGRWIKITGSPTGTAYPWSEVKWAATGTATTPSGLPSGTTSQNPAYESTGSTSVPSGAIVWAQPIADGGLVFTYSTC